MSVHCLLDNYVFQEEFAVILTFVFLICNIYIYIYFFFFFSLHFGHLQDSLFISSLEKFEHDGLGVFYFGIYLAVILGFSI